MSFNGSPAGRRAPKGYAYEEVPAGIETLLGQSPQPALPATPTAHSWNYGAILSSALPRNRLVSPTSDLELAAKEIDAIQETSRRRENDPHYDQRSRMQPQATPRRRGRPRGSQRTKREPTPDQTQLFHNLREATMSPTRDDNQQSDATPSPPVPRPVSTDSSSPADPPTQRRLSVTSDNALYPSPLYRPGSNDIPFGSTPSRHSSVDNASEVSWSLERNIHEDDLQRTRPSKYRGEPHGRNITAPPRRPSGRAHIIQEPIEEEEEDEPTPHNSPQGWTAPARTIIPQNFRSHSQAGSPRPRLHKPGVGELPPSSRPASRPSGKGPSQWIRAVGVLIFSLALALAIQFGLIARVGSIWSRNDPFENLPPNITEAEVFHTLQSRVAGMKAEMRSLSSELVAVRSEHAHEASPTSSVDPITVYQTEHKMNFLSTANGALVDPRQTTASASGKLPRWKRLVKAFTGITYQSGNPPTAALTSWQEPGDCWCTSTRAGQSQLSVLLDHDIVPEEVVIEHIPSGQTLDPGVAPRVIELWARYVVSWDQKIDYTSPAAATKGSEPLESKRSRPADIPPARDESLKHLGIASHISLHDIIMDSLRAANSHDPPSAYSDDPILGPNFYRISTMEYDIFRQNYRQQFNINTIIDIPTIRVDKVAFRVKSNWGSNNTCIYRLKLHGHI